MSKKKNTLQDLDDFLKQQAATLVTPDNLPVATPVEQEKLNATKAEPAQQQQIDLGPNQDPAFRQKLYNFIIESLEAQNTSLPEDKMLINTALYLKSGADWKNVIREYWKRQ